MKVLYFLITLVLISPALVSANDISLAVQKTVDDFCQAEFDGVQERYERAKFSSDFTATMKKDGYSFDGKVNAWIYNPSYIVRSFRVVKVEAKKDQASAIVDFERIAKAERRGSIVADFQEHDFVQFKLIYDRSKWWIYDPPLPRISAKMLMEFYKADLEGYGVNWLERSDITENQKKLYRRAQKNMNSLIELDNKMPATK